MTKEMCECGNRAVWVYMPGYSSGDNPYSCDDCVPRGCECNYHYHDVNLYHPPLDSPAMSTGIENEDWKWKEERVWCFIDEKGREYPCSEYDYDPDGFEREINPHIYEK